MGSLSSAVTTNLSTFPHVSANLPSDIITDIFTRLPVKSLSRFKCVSKSMYALVHNEIFIKEHVNRAIHQSDPKLILKNEFKLFGVEIINDKKLIRVRKLQVPFALSLEKVEISGSCNGLLCISDQRCNEDIFLFNPSIKKYRKLPVAEFDVPTMETTCFSSLGFGYHQADDDYKVIRSIYLYDKPFVDIDSYQCEARLYSVATDKWNKINGGIPYHISSRAAVCFNECLIWKASRGLGRGMTVLVVAFDMNREEFKEIHRPDQYKDSADKCQIEVGVFRGEFAMFHMWRADRVEIWTMKDFGVKESWTRMFVIGRRAMINFDNYVFVHLKPVCEMMNLNNGNGNGNGNGKNFLLIEKGDGELILYDFQNEIATDFKIQRAPRWFSVTTFVESLVSPY